MSGSRDVMRGGLEVLRQTLRFMLDLRYSPMVLQASIPKVFPPSLISSTVVLPLRIAI